MDEVYFTHPPRGPVFRLAVLLLTLSNTSPAQARAQELLNAIVAGPSPAAAEAHLEKEARSDPGTRNFLNQALPGALAGEKQIERIWILARLAGGLKVTSAIGPLCELLKGQTKSYSTTFYQADQLTDDPIALALYRIGPPAIHAVSQVLTSPDPYTRIRATRILGKIDTREARQALNTARSREKDPRVLAVLSGIQQQGQRATGRLNHP